MMMSMVDGTAGEGKRRYTAYYVRKELVDRVGAGEDFEILPDEEADFDCDTREQARHLAEKYAEEMLVPGMVVYQISERFGLYL